MKRTEIKTLVLQIYAFSQQVQVNLCGILRNPEGRKRKLKGNGEANFHSTFSQDMWNDILKILDICV